MFFFAMTYMKFRASTCNSNEVMSDK